MTSCFSRLTIGLYRHFAKQAVNPLGKLTPNAYQLPSLESLEGRLADWSVYKSKANTRRFERIKTIHSLLKILIKNLAEKVFSSFEIKLLAFVQIDRMERIIYFNEANFGGNFGFSQKAPASCRLFVNVLVTFNKYTNDFR